MIVVLHIINGLNRGGAERMLLKLITSTQSKKVNNIILSLLDRGELAEEIESTGAKVFYLGLARPSLGYVWRTIKYIREVDDIKVVQGWMYHANVASTIVWLLFFNKRKLIFNVRHSLQDWKLESKKSKVSIIIGKYLSVFADYIIYNSSKAKKQHEVFGYCTDNARVIHNGFNVLPVSEGLSFSDMFSADIVKKLTTDTVLVGKVARFHKMKGYDVFLDACAIIQKSYPNVLFVCIGRGTDSKEFVETVASLGLTGAVIMLGEVSDPRPYVSSLDICVNASHTEGMPNSVGEAMEAGIPCVATNVGDTKVLFSDQSYIVEPKDIRGLSEKIMKLIEMNSCERREIGLKNREFVKQGFNMKQVFQKYLDIY